MREKIRPQTEAQHGDVLLVDDAAQLVDLLRGEKLRLVGDDDVGVPSAGKRVRDVLVRTDDLRVVRERMMFAPSRSSTEGLMSQTVMPSSS